MINRSILRAALHLRAAYARSFADVPHRRTTAIMGSHAPTALAYSLTQAYAEARTIAAARDLGMTCEQEYESEAWDGDSPAPRHLLCLIVHDADGTPLASLGMIGVDSIDDPYLTTCEAELYAEALATLESERDAKATRDAEALATRATYAGPSEVHS